MNGTLELAFAAGGAAGTTKLARLAQSAPLRALFPETCRMDLPVAALTATCGGFTGGDHMATTIDIGRGARAMAVAQAAEKLYRSTGADTRIEVTLTVSEGGWLEWLPQETILFDGARLRRSNRIRLAPDAGVLAGEILVFGRSAHGESMTHGLVHDSWSVSRDGRALWADVFHAADDGLPEALAHPAGLAGARAAAMLVHAGPGAAGRLGLARALAAAAPAEVRCAAGIVHDVLVIRFLAPEADRLRASFAAAWMALRDDAMGFARRMPSFWIH
jgi:urease accessory protein